MGQYELVMANVAAKLDEILHYVKPAPLFRDAFELTEDGPLHPGMQLRSALVMPFKSMATNSMMLDIVAFDEVSAKLRFIDPYGYYSRELFVQFWPVKEVK